MKKIMILLLATVVFFPSASAIGGGDTDHMEDPTPTHRETDVSIGIKGVQTCINVTLDTNCTVNLTFQWLNYSDWNWYTYGEYTGVNASGQYCFWNDNVSCYTEGDWRTMWSDWRVIGNFTCGNTTYNETFYSWFAPEKCPLFYIYPPHNSTEECPCCINLCVGVNNTDGHPMDLTFYSNLSGVWDYFYLGTYNRTLTNVGNGTYCIQVPYFSLYNHTYWWYVNVTDTVTGEYDVSAIYNFTTAESPENCSYVVEEDDEGFILIHHNPLWVFMSFVALIPLALFLGKRRRG